VNIQGHIGQSDVNIDMVEVEVTSTVHRSKSGWYMY
jgi:hypothetical protein